MTVLFVDDRDLADLSFVIDSFSGPTDGVAFEFETLPLPGRYGVLPIAPEATTPIRELSFRGHIEGPNGTLEARYAALVAWVARGLVELRTGLNAEKVLHGWYQQAAGDPFPPQLLNEWGSVALTFRCFDPLAYDRYERVVTLTSAPTPIPQGTGPLVGAIRVKGITTSPLTVTKRDHAGRVTGTLTLGFTGSSFTLGANDRVEINSLTGTIQKFASGSMTNAISFLLAASDFPLVIGPDECDQVAQAWATLEISAGLSTGASAEWIGARTYL